MPEHPTVALALGAGGARGLAHIAVLEALDDLGIRPVAIAGASMGAMIGAAYAAGISAGAIRSHALQVVSDRATLLSAAIGARAGRLTDVLSGVGNPFLIDAEKLLDRLWPEQVPDRFEDLQIPFTAVATDYYARSEAIFTSGALLPAVAGSIAIPGLVRPVRHDGRALVDGGAVNPLPFDHLIGRADLVIAADVTGGPNAQAGRAPTGFETMFGTLQIMQGAIVAAKLKIYRPEIVVRAVVDRFRVLEFFEARAILAAAEPVKDELKRELERRLGRA